MMQAGHRESGFSLLEVLAAFAILALSLPLLYRAAAGDLETLSAAGERSEAAVLARSLLEEAVAGHPLTELRSSGRTGRYRWEVEIVPFAAATDQGSFRVHRVVVRVHWERGGRSREHRIETLALERT